MSTEAPEPQPYLRGYLASGGVFGLTFMVSGFIRGNWWQSDRDPIAMVLTVLVGWFMYLVQLRAYRRRAGLAEKVPKQIHVR